jgi:arylsulfatase
VNPPPRPNDALTSNTYWDWLINHVGPIYGVMDEVFKFAATFKDYPPCSIPPSFNPASVVEETLREIRAEQKLRSLFPLPAQPGEASKPKE